MVIKENSENKMKKSISYFFRIILLIIVVIAAYYFIYWVPFSLLRFIEHRWIPNIISFLCAIGIGIFVWKKSEKISSSAISTILLGAFSLGGIGFCLGFFGPIIFTPNSNQGPLLGIIITGPLGFFLGAISGLIYWLIKNKKIEGKKKV